MVFGVSGVISIVSGLATGKRMEQLQLTEFPNMPFLYWLAVAGALVKPKWTDERKWPALKVCHKQQTTRAVDVIAVGQVVREVVHQQQERQYSSTS